jgi:hypothetical protein
MNIFSDGRVKIKKKYLITEEVWPRIFVSAINTLGMTMRTGDHVYYYAINQSPSGISSDRILT